MQLIRTIWILPILCLAAFQLIGQTVSKWSVNELTFKGDKVEEPFSVDIEAIFIHEGGIQLQAPGYFNGEKQWVVRYSLPLEGSWKYSTVSSQEKLNGQQGEIEVTRRHLIKRDQ